ncbi:MFS transporter [candidate division KSB3 bacterium]|uniref:MFS transporter n=1 Tax=candidate division KSB3 bacterium TaxID=2044937 RepID=A0A9D5K0M9_9BACT|nr:MFS transporter [candidate division KSB3 bacterium]MBD3327172.1 MFS transporter [candidate division KSB3 bacterium]
MLFRFSLYGFLKNQQYYDPFLILAFLEKGLSFFQIGLLIGFREVCINLFEIPSGAVADMYGRRHAMMLSMVAYIASFLIFGMSHTLWLLFIAMFFFAIGEAFRTGTHKALIFEWLRSQNRTDEKTKVYGYTRSWAKIGSAVSVIIAAALVFYRGRYSDVFWFSIPPYVANIINFLGYPASLDGTPSREFSLKKTALTLWQTLKASAAEPTLRRLFVETMGFEGTYKVTKDYLQPILKRTAVNLPVLLWLGTDKRSAILVGIVYFLLYLLSMIASRNSYRFSSHMGGLHEAALVNWKISFLLFLALIPILGFNIHAVAILLFIGLEILQNFWRPVQVTRFDTYSDTTKGATILSIDSQAKSIFTMIAAPLLGFAVDHSGLWTIAVLGTGISLIMLSTSPWKTRTPMSAGSS